MTQMTAAELTARIAALAGHAINSVAYHQIEGEDPAIHDIHPDIGDFCDFGVSLTLENHTVAYIAWDGTFAQYGLMLTLTPLNVFESEGQCYNRTEFEPWSRLVGRRIVDTKILWSEFDHAVYPQAFLFRFDSGRSLLFSAAQPMNRPDGSIELFPISDWVAILHTSVMIENHLNRLILDG